MRVLVAHSRYSADPGTGENVHVDREIAAAGRRSVQRMIEIGQPGGGE